MAPPADPIPVVAFDSVTKDFPGVRALEDVSLLIRRGEVHGLIGENGAGKSTLMKILSGLERPSSGRVLIDGTMAELARPADAIRMGVGMIHQELNLVDELSAADNMFLGRELTRGPLVDTARTLAEARRVLHTMGVDFSPALPVKTLSIARQQLVEIAKAVSQQAKILIMDEPTAVLTVRETELLFRLIGRLKAEGVTIVYISHILPEAIRLCDRVTVLRDGRVVTTIDDMDGVTEHRLAGLMVGRATSEHFPPRGDVGRDVMLAVDHLSVPGLVHDASFDVQRGEVFGLAGLIGAGRTELGEAIAGLRRRTSGRVTVDGTPLPPLAPRAAVGRGLCYLSEDRRGRGLTLGMSVTANTTLVSLRRYCHPLVDRRQERAAAARHVDDLSIRIGRLDDPVDTLSGGNQQKVAVAKWLEMSPKVLILDEPTRGIDIAAKEELYAVVTRLVGRGMACVMISSEMNELLGMCHRIAVMRAGRIDAILDGPAATEEQIMRYAAGVGQEATA